MHSIAVLAFDRISPFHLSVPCVVFGEDRTDTGIPPFELRVCAAEPGRLLTTAGFHIEAPHGLDELSNADVVIVPSWRDAGERPPEAILKALANAKRRGAKIVGLCLGAFVLAEAGLLDGRPATTHWHWAPLFKRRYPQVTLNPDVLYIDDGDVVTSAGTAAGIDCCLHLVRTAFGAEIANRIARRLVVQPHRQGGQAQFIERPVQRERTGDRISEVIDWVRLNLAKNHSLDGLAAKALMSRRTFTRRFKQATGETVSQWLRTQRLGLAQRLLETTDSSIEEVAAKSGFGSALSMRQHFAEAFRTTPSGYRRDFRGGVVVHTLA